METYISGAFDMGKAQTNSTYAYTSWVNYNYGDNSIGMLEEEKDAIEEQYGQSIIDMWKAWVEEADQNEYDLDDFRQEDFFDEGQQQGIDRAEGDADYDGDRNYGSCYSVGASAALCATAASTASTAVKIGSRVVKGTWQITAPLVLAIGLAYQLSKPNKEAHDALMKLKDVMDTTLPQEIEESLLKLSELEANVVAARENAAATAEKFDVTAEGTKGEIAQVQVLKEEKNVELAEAQAEKALLEVQVIAATEMAKSIQARIDAGEEVSPEDLNKLPAINANIATLNGKIAELNAKISELVITIQNFNTELLDLSLTLEKEQKAGAESTENDSAQIAEEQAAYDEQGKEIASKQGYIDEAASYDTQTLWMCIAEAASQLTNVASAIIAGVQIAAHLALTAGMSVYGWMCAAFVATGGVLSGLGAKEQIDWAIDIGKEMESRDNAQTKFSEGLAKFDYHMDNWNVMKEHATVFNYGISEFELEEPDLSEPEVEGGTGA